jgi:hypothetical protein
MSTGVVSIPQQFQVGMKAVISCYYVAIMAFYGEGALLGATHFSQTHFCRTASRRPCTETDLTEKQGHCCVDQTLSRPNACWKNVFRRKDVAPAHLCYLELDRVYDPTHCFSILSE